MLDRFIINLTGPENIIPDSSESGVVADILEMVEIVERRPGRERNNLEHGKGELIASMRVLGLNKSHHEPGDLRDVMHLLFENDGAGVQRKDISGQEFEGMGVDRRDHDHIVESRNQPCYELKIDLFLTRFPFWISIIYNFVFNICNRQM